MRATAIDFAGPIYWIEWVTVNNGNFEGKDWADYNDPSVKVAVMTGTSDQLLLEKWAPKATQVQFKELSQIILAVSSGRADAFTTTVLSSMIAKEKNPSLGTFNNPKPRARAARLFRHPRRAGLHLQELPELVGGVEQPAGPQREAHEGGDAEVQRHHGDSGYGLLLSLKKAPHPARGSRTCGPRRHPCRSRRQRAGPATANFMKTAGTSCPSTSTA